jgi:hypothetical protein
VDPDPDPDWRRAKMTHKNIKMLINFIVCSAECSLLRAEGFSCSLDVLFGGLGISKLKIFIEKRYKNFRCIFIQF